MLKCQKKKKKKMKDIGMLEGPTKFVEPAKRCLGAQKP